MRLFIPQLGTELDLVRDWTFKLHAEYRNKSLIEEIEGRPVREYYIARDELLHYPIDVTIPSPATLIVDRIYIRKGSEEYSSVTFRIKDCYDKRFEKKRFWAKLDDVNTMEVNAP